MSTLISFVDTGMQETIPATGMHIPSLNWFDTVLT